MHSNVEYQHTYKHLLSEIIDVYVALRPISKNYILTLITNQPKSKINLCVPNENNATVMISC